MAPVPAVKRPAREQACPTAVLPRGGAATTDIVDACVVEGALRREDLVISSDESDLRVIAAAADRPLGIDHP
jgi:hypothetical protein